MKTDAPRKVGFLLIPSFSLLSYASAVEPLRAANRVSGRSLYTWRHVSGQGRPIEASSGLAIAADHAIGDDVDLDMLLVCAGGNPALHRNARTLSWLRKLARRGVRIGGVSGGPYILARAGLLDGYRCTIHWEHMAGFREEFPQLDTRRTLYEIDRHRLTCAGGIAGFDMMRAIIAAEHGSALAAAVSEWFLQTQLRSGSGPQRLTLRERYGVAHPKLLEALKAMEDRTQKPLSRNELAAATALSVRQLERLFANHLGTTIGDLYLKIRLDRARTLVHETALPLLEIAIACGFANGSHFSRAYRARYGQSPRRDRDAIREPE
ncbi:GlxA family transcriptional regulator [Pseudorhodoplanes sp.]|uniref:GlxA family transcriptional regulator n=1 Tax=Pseudorhodoplanes sp. TaxID=1934341 RepID=UPI002BFB87E9|nr:GlxA family transcriptional regulator [Pseudorhodoplanes sp.]HWV51163.1 GlxA family transcriptional regulator [Pseudorhodoplanes sp.]